MSTHFNSINGPQTSVNTEKKLTQAYAICKNVFLVFSVQTSGHFQVLAIGRGRGCFGRGPRGLWEGDEGALGGNEGALGGNRAF